MQIIQVLLEEDIEFIRPQTFSNGFITLVSPTVRERFWPYTNTFVP